jgi:hypothetical protein
MDSKWEVHRHCPCGSGKVAPSFYDARGIFLFRACPDCEDEKLSAFRSEVLTDSNYDCDEPIEED